MHRPAAAALALATCLVAGQAAACALSGLDGAPVEIWRAGVWRPAAPGPLDPEDAKLRTGPAARAEIACPGGLVVTVGVGTEVEVESLLAAAAAPRGALAIQVIEGIVGLVLARPRAGETSLRGPLAIAAARSTRWLLAVAPDRATAVFVRDGTVEVRPTLGVGAPATLGAGDGIDATPEGRFGRVVRWGAPRVAAAREALGFGWR